MHTWRHRRPPHPAVHFVLRHSASLVILVTHAATAKVGRESAITPTSQISAGTPAAMLVVPAVCGRSCVASGCHRIHFSWVHSIHANCQLMAKAWRAVTAWGSFCQTVRWRHLCSASRTQTWECCGRRKGGPSPFQPLVCRPVSARPPSDPPDIMLLVCSPGSVRLDSTPLSSFPIVSEALLGESLQVPTQESAAHPTAFRCSRCPHEACRSCIVPHDRTGVPWPSRVVNPCVLCLLPSGP